MSIFDTRKNLKPFEYPDLIKYGEAIQHAYWLHSEYNFTSDIQDFHTKLSDYDKGVIERTMLAVSQVEVAVKSFWGDIGKVLQKPEIQGVGAIFAESEVRHANLYSHVIEILGLNSRFETLMEVPCMKSRYDYLSNIGQQDGSKESFLKSLILFSLLTEHCSLFSQFYILMRYNKYDNVFSGIVNGVQASTAEEQIHGDFGIALINIIREEHPELFTEELEKEVMEMVDESYLVEQEIIGWIVGYDPSNVGVLVETIAFLQQRYNKSLKAIGYEEKFDLDNYQAQQALSNTQWFYDELLTTVHTDFFAKRSVNYTKKNKSFSTNDLF